MKKLIVLATLLAVTASQAAVVYWVGDALPGATSDYMDGTGWTDDFATSYGTSPLSTDSHGLIGNWGAPTIWPTISSAVPAGNTPTVVGVGWDNAYGQLDVVAGGSMSVGNLIVAFDGTGTASAGVLNMSGGAVTTSQLDLGVGVSVGTVNMSGASVLHAGTASAANGSTINMADSAFFLINGDWTGAGLVGAVIFATDVGTSIQEVYNATDARTEWTVIPEPATLGMVAALGGALLFIRRRFII